MLYPLKRLANAMEGKENNLIELTLLLQNTSEEMPIIRSILEHQNITNPNQHSRYLLAFYKYYRGIQEEENKAFEELRQLAAENYPLALNFIYFNEQVNKPFQENQLPPGLIKSKNNLLIAANIAANKNDYNELIGIYNKCDAKENRFFRRTILANLISMFKASNSEIPQSSLINIRAFLIDEFRFSEYKNIVALTTTVMDDRLFKKKELSKYFTFITDLSGSVGEALKAWNAKSLGNYSFAEMQEEIYNLESFLARKDYFLEQQFESINAESSIYSASDAGFAKQHTIAKKTLTESFSKAEFILAQLYKLAESHGLNPQKAAEQEKRHKEILETALQHHTQQIDRLKKEKDELISRAVEGIISLTQTIDQQSAAIFQTYHNLIDSISKHFTTGSEIGNKLNALKQISADSLSGTIKPIVINNLTESWHNLLLECKETHHPLYPHQPILEIAFKTLNSELNRNDRMDFELFKNQLKQDLSRMRSTFLTSMNDIYKRTNISLYSSYTTPNQEAPKNIFTQLIKFINLLDNREELTLENIQSAKTILKTIISENEKISYRKKQVLEDLQKTINKIEYYLVIKNSQLSNKTEAEDNYEASVGLATRL